LLLALIGGGKGLAGFAEWSEIANDPGTTTGTVVGCNRPGMKGQLVQYAFQYQTRMYQGSEVGNHYIGPTAIGNAVTVTFSRRNPNTSTLDLAYVKWNASACSALGFSFAVIGALYVLGFLRLFRSDRSRPTSGAKSNQ